VDSKSKKEVKKFEFDETKKKSITTKNTSSKKFEFEIKKPKIQKNKVVEQEINVEDLIEDDEIVKENKVDIGKVVDQTDNPKFTRHYFNFETRVVIMMVIVLVLFGCACFFSLEAINFGKNEIVSYDEVGEIDYKVCLKPNEFYNEQCINEGMEYVSDMVDKISAVFDYNVDFSTNIEYDLYYHVAAITTIYDASDTSRILYQNSDNLINKTTLRNNSKNIKFNDTISIDYSKYNEFVGNYINQYALNSSAADVSVILYLDEPAESREVARLTIPLGKQTFGITKSSTSNKNRTVEIVNDTWNEYNTVCAFLATVLVVVSLGILFKTTRLVLKVTGNKNKYQAKIQDILREHDRIIVIARDGYESNIERTIIKVESFEELLAAHETLKKPIIFSKVNDVKCEFIVEDNKTLYKYVLKEADL